MFSDNVESERRRELGCTDLVQWCCGDVRQLTASQPT